MSRSLTLALAAGAALAACGPAAPPRLESVARSAVVTGLAFNPPPPAQISTLDCFPIRVALIGDTNPFMSIVDVTASDYLEVSTDPTCGAMTTYLTVVIDSNQASSEPFYIRGSGSGVERPGRLEASAFIAGTNFTVGPVSFQVVDANMAFLLQPPLRVTAGEMLEVSVAVAGSLSGGAPVNVQPWDRVHGNPGSYDGFGSGWASSYSPAYFTGRLFTAGPQWELRADAGGSLAASQIFEVVPGTPVIPWFSLPQQRSGVPFAFSPVVADDYSNPISTTVTASLVGGGSVTLGGTTQVLSDATGHADFVGLVITTVGNHQLRLTAGTAIRDSYVTVVPGPAVVTFLAAPSGSIEAGASIPVTVQVKDAHGNDHTASVTITVEDAVQFQLGAWTANPAGGQASTTLSVTKAGTWWVRARINDTYGPYGTYEQTSGPFTVVPKPPSVTFMTPPPPALTAGGTFDANVRVWDEYANPISTTVALSLEPAGAATLSGTTALATIPSTGVAAFSGLSISKAGTYTVKASVIAPVAPATAPLTVSPASVSAVTFVQQPPASPSADETFQVAVRVEDAFQNPLDGTVDLDLVAANGAVVEVTTTAASLTRTASAGVATFPHLAVRKAGGPYRLRAAFGSPPLTGTSQDVDVRAGAVTALAFQDFQATTATASFTLPPIHVAVEDAWANVITTAVAPITLGFASSPPAAVLGGTATRTPALGVATFADIVLDTPGPYRLRATQGAIAGTAPADTVVYAPGSDFPAHHLAFATPPRTVAPGACSDAIRVEARDATDQRLRLLTPIALALAGSGVTYFADATCDASPVTTTEISRAGVAEFRARSGATGARQLAVQADLTCVNGCTPGVGVKSTVQDLVVQAGAGGPAGGARPRDEDARPLNGWSAGCAASGGAPSLAALVGLLAVLVSRGRRGRGGIAAGIVVALLLPERGWAQGGARRTTSTPTSTPTSTSTSTQITSPIRRTKDPRPAVAVLTVESSVPGEKLDVAALTDVFAAALDEPRWFRVVAPRDVTAALALERQKELLGCSADQSCLAELAGALGVDLVASASVGRVRESLVVSGRLIDPRRGVGVARSSVSADPEQLVAAIGDSALGLLETYRAGRPADEQERLDLPGRRTLGGGGSLALRIAGVAAYAPGAEAGARGSFGGELGISWRAGAAWSLVACGVAGPNPGFRLGVLRQLTGGALRLSAGLRGAGWPGAGAYGGGAVVEAAVGLTRALDLVGSVAAEGYAAEARYGKYAALGGVGIAMRL